VYTRCPYADNHLDELRTAYREEGHLGLPCHSTGQQCFPSPRRSDQEDALGDAPAQALKLLRALKVTCTSFSP
jgi:hypothetical protein